MSPRLCIAALIVTLPMAAAGCSHAFPAAATPGAEGALPRTVVQAQKIGTEKGAPAKAPAFEYAYAPPGSPGLQQVYQRVRDVDLLRQLPEVQAIDGMFALPRPLRYVTAECGEFGAFYRSLRRISPRSGSRPCRNACR